MRKLNICIVQPTKNTYSETFLRQQLEHLEGNIFPVYGSWMPEFTNEDVRLTDHYFKNHPIRKIINLIVKLLPALLYNRLPENFKGHPFGEKFLRLAFKQYLIDNQIEVVIAQFFAKGIVVMDICQELKIPYIVYTHGGGDIMNYTVQHTYKQYFKDFFRTVSTVIVVDNFSFESLISLGLERQKIRHIKCGVDINFFKKISPAANNRVFFGVGRFTNQKAPYLTILAFEKVLKKYKDVVLYLGGQGELLDCCKQLVKALKISESVFFLGVLSPSEVLSYMQKSRAFIQHSIHTSLGESEGTPVAVLEAMACGLPVISTFHNGIGEVINNGKNGLVVPEHDIELMSEYMIKVLDDPSYANTIGDNARATIEMEYTQEIAMSRLNNLVSTEVVQFEKYVKNTLCL